MKIGIVKNYFLYYITFDQKVISEEIASKLLGIDFQLYCHILRKYGAEGIFSNIKDLHFTSENDANKFLNSKELEPYIMMLNLIA